MTSVRMASSSSVKHNRLINEKSPYLLQHATNPVHWYPWGEEAFQAARTENKLIFLSVGYSTCHWCHVMERESFESTEVAKVMNDHFINVKVDREERPDVDKVYMTFVTSLTRRGGWPMSVWLTPDLKPVYGGTYFPPDGRYYGQPGFTTILQALAKQWKENKEKCQASGDEIIEELKKVSKLPTTATDDINIEQTVSKCLSQYKSSYDSEYGGFSRAPKFPQPSNNHFLMTYFILHPTSSDAMEGKDMVLHTLSMMDKGGIHDHISQGFARYSTDNRWHVPHFEKMLYDQGQLVMSYLDAYVVSEDERYADVVRDILTYVSRDLSHPSGGFYSAEDADSLPKADSTEKKEGAFCCWTYEEVNDLLKEPITEESDILLANVFCHHYSVMENGNVDPSNDPHNELENQNVLIVHGSVAETAEEFTITEAECSDILEKCRVILYEERGRRPRPHLDDKMVTAWNGMMIESFARAGIILGEKSYIDRAVSAATFIEENLWKDGQLLRAAYNAEGDSVSLGSSINGFADDYAWTIRALLQLYEATLSDKWLIWAEQLQDRQDQLFWDTDSAGYFMAQPDGTILLRLKEEQDGAEPSVNSVSAGNLLRLGRVLNKPEYLEKAKEIHRVFSPYLKQVPIALPEMMTSLILSENALMQIIISGHGDCPVLKDMLQVIHNHTLSNKVLLYAPQDKSSYLYSKQSNLLKYFPNSADVATVYVCNNFVCSLPVTSPDKLKEELKRNLAASN